MTETEQRPITIRMRVERRDDTWWALHGILRPDGIREYEDYGPFLAQATAWIEMGKLITRYPLPKGAREQLSEEFIARLRNGEIRWLIVDEELFDRG